MLNQVILMGRLTAEPELKTTTGGTAVLSCSIAVERAYSKDAEKQTDFIPVVFWAKTAEFVAKYFHKGNMIAVSGALQSRKYEDKDGNKRTAFEVIANTVSFCGDKSAAPAPTAAPASSAIDDSDSPLAGTGGMVSYNGHLMPKAEADKLRAKKEAATEATQYTLDDDLPF